MSYQVQKFNIRPRTVTMSTTVPGKFTRKQDNAWIPPQRRKDVNQASLPEIVYPSSKSNSYGNAWNIIAWCKNTINKRNFDIYSAEVTEILQQFCKEDFEDVIELFCTDGIEHTASADEMIYINLLKSIRNDAKTAKQFDGCLEAVYLRYLGQKSKRQIILKKTGIFQK